MLEDVKLTLKEQILSKTSLDVAIEEPKRGEADLAIPLFRHLKDGYKLEALKELLDSAILDYKFVSKTILSGAFYNIYLKRQVYAEWVHETILTRGEAFGNGNLKETVVIDYSSPNIAKNFSIGHLRTTIIGHSLKLIYQKSGANVIGINHLGDWGTQFGKLIVAYNKWGDPKKLSQNPIGELQKIYVKFHKEAELNPSLEDEARLAFKLLEDGDPKMLKLWNYFKDESLKTFMRVYQLLGITFDSYHGEAFYNDKMDEVLELLKSKGLSKIDDGATIVELGDDIPPALIKRSDGATLYMTRDLAALLYRVRTYHNDKMLYVVGNEQKLHFEQLKRIAKLLDIDCDIRHINFGMILSGGKKMSTRTGLTANLEDVLNEAIKTAKQAILEKNPELKDLDVAARKIGVGAILFNDLKVDRISDVDFDLEAMLKFEGQTGPYLQYSGVRINSILSEKKLDAQLVDYKYFEDESYFELTKMISQFDDIILKALETDSPSVIAKYLLSLTQAFNRFYAKERIIVSELAKLNANLLLITNLRTVLKEGLRLLGMEFLDKM